MSPDTLDPVVKTAIENPSDSTNFAKWIGIDPATLVDDQPDASAAASPADADDAVPDAATDATIDADTETAAPETPEASEPADDAAPPAEAVTEPVKLPFEAKAGEEPVDPALLAKMEVTLKADGKDVTLPLADVVRRAQSEPAAQRQAREAREYAKQIEADAAEVRQALAEVRAVALRMARDPAYYADVIQQVEQYDAPDARAERAERQLAAERERQEQDRQRQAFQERVTAFAAEVVAPTLSGILEAAPLVKQEELLGKFYADTAAITVNGIIPVEYHADLAHYLRTDFAEFAKARQAEETARENRIREETKRAQMERQRIKNQTANAAKPVGTVQAPGRDSATAAKPRTIREAEQGALSVLLGAA